MLRVADDAERVPSGLSAMEVTSITHTSHSEAQSCETGRVARRSGWEGPLTLIAARQGRPRCRMMRAIELRCVRQHLEAALQDLGNRRGWTIVLECEVGSN
jgi:hypothetical protein